MDTLAALTRARTVTVKHIEIFVKNFIRISEMKNVLFQKVFFITNIYTLLTKIIPQDIFITERGTINFLILNILQLCFSPRLVGESGHSYSLILTWITNLVSYLHLF